MSSRKGGIIIEYKLKNVLLKRELMLIQMVILGIALIGSNTSYASNSITATKDRIEEIKIVEEENIDKLIRNNKTEKEVKYTRQTKVTSRGDVNRNTEEVKEEKNEEIEQEYTSLEDVKISKNMDLTKRTGLSKEDFKKVMKNLKQDTSKFFYNNADEIYDLCEKYEINEIFFCGLISAESGWNIAQNHRNTHNYISLMSKGKLIHYSSTEEGLEVAAQKLHNNYLTPGGKFYGGKTLEGVHKKFCPSSTWVNLVYGRMNQVMTAVKKAQ